MEISCESAGLMFNTIFKYLNYAYLIFADQKVDMTKSYMDLNLNFMVLLSQR